MSLKIQTVAYLFAVLFATTLAHSVAGADADDQAPPSTNSAAASDPRFGLFNWLDHRSAYNGEFFPEPLLMDDIALEDNELELRWLRTKGAGQQSDTGSAEFQKGFGLLTLQAEVPYERNVSPDQTAEGVGNIELGARCPFYQFVSANRFVDTTFGVALEGGIPVHLKVEENAEFTPQIFNDLRLGDHFMVQSILGYSMLFGGGDDGGLQTFEYGFSFDYMFLHRDLPLPDVQQFLPMFEIVGERGLNKDEAGQNDVQGAIGFRAKFNPIGEVQPGIGLGYVFPIDREARGELHWGFIVSMVFEF